MGLETFRKYLNSCQRHFIRAVAHHEINQDRMVRHEFRCQKGPANYMSHNLQYRRMEVDNQMDEILLYSG